MSSLESLVMKKVDPNFQKAFYEPNILNFFQLISQYIHSFEFDESFLIFLFEHAYASEFGSFLGSSEMVWFFPIFSSKYEII